MGWSGRERVTRRLRWAWLAHPHRKDAPAGLGMPLVCDTGGEKSRPRLRPDTTAPWRLDGAPGFYPEFARLVTHHGHGYGDTPASCLPRRWAALRPAVVAAAVREKLGRGSDWPSVALPDPGLAEAWSAEAVALACGGREDGSLEVRAFYYESPFIRTLVFKADGDELTVTRRVNVAFGPTALPTIRAAAG